jgi:hypothetical protein
VFYTTSADMLSRLNASLADGTLMQIAIKPYVRADLLIVDEVGMEEVERQEACRLRISRMPGHHFTASRSKISRACRARISRHVGPS